MGLKNMQKSINTVHPFGIKLWKPPLYRTESRIKRMTDEEIHQVPHQNAQRTCNLGNLAYVAIVGWWVSIPCLFSGILMFIVGSYKYGSFLIRLSGYLLWPFGRSMNRAIDYENQRILLREENQEKKVKSSIFHRFVYYILYMSVLGKLF